MKRIPIKRRTSFQCPDCGGPCTKDRYPPRDTPANHSVWLCDRTCNTWAYEVHDYHRDWPVAKMLVNVMTIS